MMRTHLAVVCVCFLRIVLAQDIPLGCGGFLKSTFDVDFTRVKVSCHILYKVMLSTSGLLIVYTIVGHLNYL